MTFTRRVGYFLFGVIIAAVAVYSTPSAAQSSDTERLDAQTKALRQILDATGRAISQGNFSNAPVTYADVLKDPDNIDLNLRFARSQIGQGNYRGASATLERILLMSPDIQPVKLLYAVVLFRQGNLDEAEREFKALSRLEMPDSLRAEVENYLSAIRTIRQRTRYAATLSFGLNRDSNVNSAPQSNTRLFLDTPIRVDRPETDFSYIGFGSFSVDHDLGFQEGHSVFASVAYYQDDKVAEDSQDIQSFTARGGGVYRNWFMNGDLTADLSYSQVRLSRETFLHEYGGDLRYDRTMTDRITGFIAANLAHQSFSPIRENATSEERNGRRVSGQVGLTYTYRPDQLVSVDYQLLDRNAKGRGAVEFFSYMRQQVNLSHTWLLGDGQFLLSNFSYQRDRYSEADPFISSRKRRDNIIRMRVTYGAPLSYLIGSGGLFGGEGVSMWKPLEDITVTPSLEFSRAQSNLQNFDFNNWKTQVLFTKSWNF